MNNRREFALADLLVVLPLALAVLRSGDDQDLVLRLQRRDQDAAAELYDRYGRLVFSIIFRIVKDQSVAEELVQETMLRVWNRLPIFDAQRGTLSAWMVTVARNQAIDYVRSAGGRAQQGELKLDAMEAPSLFSDLGLAEREILQFDQIRKVRAALEKLNPNQRAVLELAYYEGLSQSEMAERLSQPLGTVKTWVRGALQVMRENLQESLAS